MLLAITGGISSGKSLAGEILAEWGAFRMDTDALARELLREDETVRRQAREAFGARIFTSRGAIDHKRLAETVFRDPEKLRALEDILHPPILRRWQKAAAQAPQALKVAEIPLLFEKKLENRFNFIVCISASLATRQARWKAKGLPEADFHARNARQMSLAEKIKLADCVISNNGTIEFTRRQTALLAARLNAL